ncbi:carbohydrate ABC transporter permease [Lichenicoccus sp.]|uniref:carbohydrate ABC transporter permease n=1 Tax=Lichenicoccus sp. TaxID=2781899 RepID=UPI003D14A5D8
MRHSPQAKRVALSVLGWIVGGLTFFPIFWMAITSVKTEAQAISSTPLLFFRPTFENLETMLTGGDYLHFATNSAIVSIGSTLAALLLGIPAAYAMAYYPSHRTKDLLLWMLSTKMMPSVGVLVPVYLIFRDGGLLDTRIGLVGIDTLANLPIAVWMLYSFFRDVPHEILEAARMDGAGFLQQMLWLLLPLAAPGIAATGLLSIILSWNETFWSINLTSSDAAPLTAFIASFSSPEGLFWARLSAASLLAIAPILALGWMTQRQLVRGLTFGAVK